PGRSAFNRANALFHLDRFDEAERLYRACADGPEPRRTQARYNRGVCLLRRASGRDAAALRGAGHLVRQCLADADGELRADARFNLELAKRLLRLARPGESEREGGPEGPEPPPPDDQRPGAPEADPFGRRSPGGPGRPGDPRL